MGALGKVPWRLVGYGVAALAVLALGWRIHEWRQAFLALPAAQEALLDEQECNEGSKCAERVLAFCDGAEVLIHNAAFDLSFLDAELARVGHVRFRERCGGVLDTLLMARELHPGKRNSLDALCDRYGVSNSHRTLHGALLDSELLAEVYLAMTRGQDSFEIALDAGDGRADGAAPIEWPPRGLAVKAASPAEAAAHEAALAAIGKERKGQALWIMAPSQPA
jgi:DNA polymerase-3 subunit epsilon